MMDAGMYELVGVVVSFAVGVIGASKYYKKFKQKLKEVREVVDAISTLMNDLDNAFADDKITKEEVEKIYKDLKKLYKELVDIIK